MSQQDNTNEGGNDHEQRIEALQGAGDALAKRRENAAESVVGVTREYTVDSDSGWKYTVRPSEPSCTCKDFEYRGDVNHACKHIIAVCDEFDEAKEAYLKTAAERMKEWDRKQKVAMAEKNAWTDALNAVSDDE